MGQRLFGFQTWMQGLQSGATEVWVTQKTQNVHLALEPQRYPQDYFSRY